MGEDTPEMRAKFVASIPLGRLSQPSDIATAAVFFASDEASFITGACLEVDGGRCVSDCRDRIRDIDHVVLRVSDLARSLAFYRDVLRLPRRARAAERSGCGSCARDAR